MPHCISPRKNSNSCNPQSYCISPIITPSHWLSPQTTMINELKYFLPYQRKWILDLSPLKIMQKSRQIGISYADAYHSVRIASNKKSRLDVYISSRDRFQAKLYVEDCKHWAEILHEVILDLGEMVLDPEHDASAFVIQFANGRR